MNLSGEHVKLLYKLSRSWLDYKKLGYDDKVIEDDLLENIMHIGLNVEDALIIVDEIKHRVRWGFDCCPN
tara:strand:- start:33 stop:242 length:210 start_codon:yes stop_codon:yes gene_type:complete